MEHIWGWFWNKRMKNGTWFSSLLSIRFSHHEIAKDFRLMGSVPLGMDLRNGHQLIGNSSRRHWLLLQPFITVIIPSGIDLSCGNAGFYPALIIFDGFIQTIYYRDMGYPVKKDRSERVAVKVWCPLTVQVTTTISQLDPLHTPVRKQIELGYMSESTMGSIPCLSKSCLASCDACPNPFPCAAICNDGCNDQSV